MLWLIPIVEYRGGWDASLRLAGLHAQIQTDFDEFCLKILDSVGFRCSDDPINLHIIALVRHSIKVILNGRKGPKELNTIF